MMQFNEARVLAFVVIYLFTTNAIIHFCFVSRDINIYRSSLFLKKRITASILMSNSASDDSDASDPSNRKIISLLNRAVEYASNQLSNSQRSNSNSNSTVTKMSQLKQLLPLRISFSARHFERLFFNDTFFAQKYLSLSPNEYSLLNSTMFSHLNNTASHQSADLTPQSSEFTISLPLGDLSSALQTALFFTGLDSTSSSQSSFFKDVALCSTVKVLSEPDIGVITMRSGPLLLVSDASDVNNVFTYEECSQNNEGYPSWLVWGNDSSLVPSTKSSYGSVSPNMSIEVIGGDTGAKISAIQTGFEINLKWNAASTAPNPSSRRNNINKDNNNSKSRGRLSRILNLQRDDSGTEDLLRVDATVRAWVQLGIPVRRDVATALNLLPVRLLLSQAGRLIMISVMKAAAPRLGSSLVDDFERWKNDNLE